MIKHNLLCAASRQRGLLEYFTHTLRRFHADNAKRGAQSVAESDGGAVLFCFFKEVAWNQSFWTQ